MLRSSLLLLPVCVLVLMSASFPRSVISQRNTRAPLELVNKGYINLLVGISERVPEDIALLDRIQFVFTETSKFLYKATNQRAYFKDIHILVPESWSNSDAYTNVDWQRYDQSDVIIDIPSDSGGNRPYTNKPTPCGEPGLFIHLTPDYIISQSIAGRYGDYDKTLVHEWAHYRWGVFDEFPLEAGQHFYAAKDGAIEAVRCVLGITGRMVNPSKGFIDCEIEENGFPERDCRFLDNTAATGFTGSLMYKQFLPQISTFCEKSTGGESETNGHNREAPNLQNIQCRGKSIWEVMLEHRDFTTGNKKENSVNDLDDFDGEPVPKFTIVKRKSSRLVLVLDRSGSMKGQRLTQLRQAAQYLISGILVDGEELGIVTFALSASISSELRSINDESRQRLLELLPSSAVGATSIGAGVEKGLEVLGRNGPAAGGKMIVITDGDENRRPYIDDVLHLVNDSGVTIDTIAIGPDASPSLELLSSSTGGSAYYHDESSNTLSEAFSKSSTTGKAVTSLPASLYADFVKIPPGTNFTGAVFVDSTVGRDTQFLFGHVSDGAISVVIIDPEGTVISEGSSGYESIADFKQIRVVIPGYAEIGLWTFMVENKQSDRENVTIFVQSHAGEDGDPILINARWGLDSVIPPQKQSLYVSVGKGYIPVINSDVTAVIELPCNVTSVTLEPKDDGIGADVRKDDGVYSAYFTEFCGEGRYGTNIKVTSRGSETSVAFGDIIGAGAAADPTYGNEDAESRPELDRRSTGDFQRVAGGESFKCEGADICNGTIDRYPPARITDLRANNVDIDNMQITLNFTAPGDDLMQGRASGYIIKIARSSSELLDDFEAAEEIPKTSYVTGDVSITSNAGESEVFVISVTEIGKFSYFFSVVAVDDEGNKGDPSNIATSSAREFRQFPLALVIGLSVGGVLLVIILIGLTALLCCRKRKPKQSDTREIRERNMTYCVPSDVEETRGHIPSRETQHYESAGGEEAKVQFSGRNANQHVSSVVVNQNAASGLAYPNPTDDSDPLYDNVISRREKDPNWDPTSANNREGGGAHIKTGHVSNAVSMFVNKGFTVET